jgi:tetratricopeptide (TPR) repeat protein
VTAPQDSLLKHIPLPLLVAATALALNGCTSTQSRARQESTERWNRVRAEVKAQLASDQLAAGHVDDAATQLAEAFRLDPENPQLRVLQAQVYLAQGDLAATERLLATVQAEGPLAARVEYLLGVVHEQHQQWPAALECFVCAASQDPEEVAYVVAIVQVMLQLGQAADALTLLESYEPEFGWTNAYHAARAECLEQVGNWPQAASAWRKVVDASDDPGIRERLATALCQAGQTAEAVRQLEELLATDDAYATPALRLTLAECLFEERQLTAAHEHVNLVLYDDPRNVPALKLAARIFAAREQFQRACQNAEQALRLAPDDLGAHELAAALAFRIGDQGRALTLAKRIRGFFPDADSPVASQILKRLDTPSAATGE